MKICLANPTFTIRRPIADLAQRLSDEHEVTVLTPRRVGSDAPSLSEDVRVRAYPCLDFFVTRSEWPIPSPFFFFTARETLRDQDVVHAWVPLYISHTLLALLSLMIASRFALTMDTVQGYSHSRGAVLDTLFTVYYKTLGGIVFAAADRVTLYSERFRSFAEQAGVPTEKLRITTTGVDTDVRDSDSDIRDEFAIEDDVVLFVGMLVHRKGVDTVVKVAELFDATFLIVGDGSRRDAYERAAPDNVLFTGYREDVENFYEGAEVMLFPSRGEGLPGVVMEAMAHGLPVVASDIPGSRELLPEDSLCPVEDVDCYVERLRTHLAEEQERGEAVREAVGKYAWETRIEEFTSMYEDLKIQHDGGD